MARSALLVVCGLLVLAPLAGCSGLAGGPAGPSSPSAEGTSAGASTGTATLQPSATPASPSGDTATPTPPPSATRANARTPTPTPTPVPTAARLSVGSADPPGEPDLAGVPARYRTHVAATGSYRLSSSFVVSPDDGRVDRVDATAIRGTGVAADRVRRADTFRSYDDELVTARTVTASYRPATGPHLYHRNDSFRAGPEAGTIQGASYREAIGYPPWRGSKLAVRLAAAARLTDGESVTVGGDRATRHRVTGLNRSAYDALGLRERDDLLERVAGTEAGAAYPDRATGTVTVDAADRIRRVNLTLERPRRNGSVGTVRRQVAVDARLRPVDGAVDPPSWVERTQSLRFERLPDAGGVAFAVEHVRGPPLRRPSGSLRTGNATTRTEFLLLVRGTLHPGGTLYVWVAPRDDENGMEAYTAVDDRPDGPFVRLRVRGLELFDTVRHDGVAWETRHLLELNATNGR